MKAPAASRFPRGRNLWLAGLLFLAALGTLQAADRVVIEPPLVSPSDPQARERIEDLLQKASLLANREYANWLEVAAPGAAAAAAPERAYRVNVVAVLEDNPAVALVMESPGGRGQARNFALLGAPGPETVHYLARALFFLWASHQEALRLPRREPPQLLEELPVDPIAESLLPAMKAALIPFSAAVSGQGSLIVGLSLFAVELDRSLRIVDTLGLPLYEQGTMGVAQSLTATPEGTVYLKAAMGSELYRFSSTGASASAPAARIRLRGTPYGPLAALADGSVALLNTMDRRLWRVEGERVREVPLGANPDAWPTAMAVGPEQNLWIYYPVERRIKIHAPSGELLDSVLPLTDYGQPIEASAMAVYPDGRFLLYGRQGLWCFARTGLPLWRLEELPSLVPGSSPEPLPQQAGLALDPAAGILYLTDLSGRRILKLLDTSYCEDLGIAPALELEILRLNRRQAGASREAAATVDKALLYERAGAFEMARVQWERALEIEPGNRRAEAALAAVEQKLGRAAAGRAGDKAVEILEQVGPESARRYYREAMQLYEALAVRYPQDGAARREMEELKRRFEEGTGGRGSGAGGQALALEGVEAENLFPALMQEYHRRPVVRLRVRNTVNRPLRDLQASVLVERFMDFPSESALVPSLEPGGRATLELKVPLNPRVLELEENLPVQGQVEITYRVGSGEQRLRSSVSFIIYRRTALRWDDSGKLSSFITPNEGVVSAFALRVAETGGFPPYRLSDRFLRAMRLCDALGAFGIRYVEDPDSPISRALGAGEIVDTVRFPRVTLQVRSGDCDDTTALLSSLLEAVGVRTAILTCPGHVFLAFDTGESPALSWALEGPERAVIVRGGTVWLPVETTVLSDGFLEAWRQASRLYRRHQPAGQVEFLPVRELRERYDPIPLPPSSLPVVEPSEREIESLAEKTLQGLERTVYGERLRELDRELAAQQGRQGAAALRLANRIGILHAVFGRDAEAELAFRGALGQEPGYQASALNLANLQISKGRLEEAEAVLRQALGRDPGSPAVNLLLAQLYHRRADRRSAQEHFRVVERRDPELAARFGYLAEAGRAAGERAGSAEPPSPFWE